jgi:uncharacterized protein involved in type VI secretion and phage assembly
VKAGHAAAHHAQITAACRRLAVRVDDVSGRLSSLGETQLNLLSPKSDLKPEDLLGKSVTVTVQQRDDAKRHFNGFVSRFGAGSIGVATSPTRRRSVPGSGS